MTIDASDLIIYPAEERIYRMRCVRDLVHGHPLVRLLHKLLKDLTAPLPEAKYIRTTTLLDPEQMPGQQSSSYLWPYTEGLRLDSFMEKPDPDGLGGLSKASYPAGKARRVRLVVLP